MKSTSAKLAVLVVAFAALLILNACSSTENKQANASQNTIHETVILQDGSRADVVTETATKISTVESVNASERSLVLRFEDGTEKTIVCGPGVRNFDRIEVGDHVKVTIAQEVAVVLAKDDLPPVAQQSSTIIRSQQGAKPGGKIVHTTAFTARVKAVDVPNRRVTLETSDGLNRTVNVSPKVNLAKVRPGDDVGVRVTEAVAISVGKL